MKKYLLIFLVAIFQNSFSDVTYEEAVIENLQDMGSNVSDIQFQLSNFFSSDPENGYDLSLRDLLYHALYETDLPSIPRMLTDIVDQNVFFLPYLESINDYIYNVLPEYLYNLSPTDILFYLQDGNVADNIQSIDDSLRNLEEIKIAVTQLGDKYDQVIVNGSNVELLMQDIISELRKQNGGGGSSGDLPIDTVGYYELGDYGKDVNIKGLTYHSVTTTGEYNQDVLRLLLNLNHVGGSQLNASLSILTNVQAIAESVSGEGQEEKAEKDVEERQYKAESAISEANSINSIDWSSFFTVPKFLSDSWNNLTITLQDIDAPQHITIIDTFHYESKYFTAELANIGFDIPNAALDLAFYARQVFGFIYWTLAFFIAFFVCKLWFKLYLYVSNVLFNT